MLFALKVAKAAASSSVDGVIKDRKQDALSVRMSVEVFRRA